MALELDLLRLEALELESFLLDLYLLIPIVLETCSSLLESYLDFLKLLSLDLNLSSDEPLELESLLINLQVLTSGSIKGLFDFLSLLGLRLELDFASEESLELESLFETSLVLFSRTIFWGLGDFLVSIFNDLPSSGGPSSGTSLRQFESETMVLDSFSNSFALINSASDFNFCHCDSNTADLEFFESKSINLIKSLSSFFKSTLEFLDSSQPESLFESFGRSVESFGDSLLKSPPDLELDVGLQLSVSDFVRL